MFCVDIFDVTALRRLDPSIELILCGENGYSDWVRVVIDIASHVVDHVSIHNFTFSDDPLQNSTAPLIGEHGIRIAGSLIDMAFTQNTDREVLSLSGKRPRICFNEWNVWDMKRWPGEQGSEQVYTLSDALGVAVWLNTFVRNAAVVSIASPAQSVNAISALHVHKDGLLRHATYPIFRLFANYMRGMALDLHVAADVYEGPTDPAWLQQSRKIPYLDAAGTMDPQTATVNVALVNRASQERRLLLKTLDMIPQFKPFQRWEVVAKELSSSNSLDCPGAVEAVDRGSFDSRCVLLPNNSVTLLRWRYPIGDGNPK